MTSSRVDKTASESIAWAVEPHNTSTPMKYGVPNGFGLSLVYEVIKSLGGVVQIVSADGYWGWLHGDTVSRDLAHAFPGTVVHIQWPTEVISAEQDQALSAVFARWGASGSGGKAG